MILLNFFSLLAKEPTIKTRAIESKIFYKLMFTIINPDNSSISTSKEIVQTHTNLNHLYLIFLLAKQYSNPESIVHFRRYQNSSNLH